ncbi:MAG: glycosyltransferase family 2 protein [Sphingomonadales bacterium]
MDNHHVAVVIPYFQKTAGILSRAVRSALQQRDFDDYHIVVVDDASPVPAREELQAMIDARPDKFAIIEKTNGGPGTARNTALDSLPAHTPFVAFLDSDDEWTDTHLRNAIAALDKGYDCYFADHYQLGSGETAFNKAHRLDLAEHEKLDGPGPVYGYTKDMFDQILMGNVIGTSTVVYRFHKFPLKRFRERFRMAGEDYIFWLDLCTGGARFAFSAQSECTYGKGVNVYSGSGWGTDNYLDLLHDEIGYRKFILELFSLTKPQTRYLNRRISGFRAAFVRGLIHELRRGNIGALTKLARLAAGRATKHRARGSAP